MQIYQINAATEVIPGLFVSGKREALSSYFLRSRNIQIIVNATKTVSFLNNDLLKIRLPIDDDPDQSSIFLAKLPDVVNTIVESLQNGGPVLVHCAQGISRSCSIIVAVLLKLNPYQKLDDAVKFLKEKRPVAFALGMNFRQALETYRLMVLSQAAQMFE